VRLAALAVVGVLALAAVAGAPAGASTGAADPQATLPDLEDEVMCPICGVPLGQAPDAPQAERQRAFIRRLIAQGQDKEEIKDALVAEFGPEVLAVPEAEGFGLAAWVVPGLGILAAALAIGFGLARWRRAPGSRVAPTDASAEASATDAERLDADLARYEL
jgi:cytochrome c-type biogenesis protein CcmH